MSAINLYERIIHFIIAFRITVSENESLYKKQKGLPAPKKDEEVFIAKNAILFSPVLNFLLYYQHDNILMIISHVNS